MNPDDPLGIMGPGPQQQPASGNDPLGIMQAAPQTAPAQPTAAPPVAPEQPGYMQQALGGLASFGRHFPGLEPLQAMAAMPSLDLTQAGDRAKFPAAYRTGLQSVRDAEDAAPAPVRNWNGVVGGLLSGAAMPGSNVALQGARYGAAEGLLGADPSTVADRLHAAAWKAPVDAALGHSFGEILPQFARSVAAKSVDTVAGLRKGAMSLLDNAIYGKADAEGALSAANPMPQALSDAFNDPTIKPYVDAIKNSPVWEGASPGKVLHEAYKLMSERQGKLGTMVANSADFKAGSQLEHDELSMGKQKLLAAADEIMPSFRQAVEGHANLAGQYDAFTAARDATSNIVKGAAGPTRGLTTKSPDAFMRSILGMTPGQASAGTQGLLGQLKEASTINPLKAAVKSWRVAPYLNALDAQAGRKLVPGLLRAGAVSSGGLLGY